MSASSAAGLYAVCGSFIGLSTIAVGLRFYGRKHQSVSLGIDDWSALFGVITYIAACACGIELAVLKEEGYDTSSLTPAQMAARLRPSGQISIAYDFLNMNTLACAKWSALFLYRRIFALDRHGTFNRVILVTAVVIGMWYIAIDLLSAFQCHTHLSAALNGQFAKYCDLNPVWAKSLAISDFLLDIWVMVLPIPSIWLLHTTTSRKLATLGVFLLAFVGLGASIARIVYFFQLHAPGRQVLYVGLLESGMSITVVNLPTTWYLCTSTIPSKVARSLRSIRSLGSDDSQNSRLRGETESGIRNGDGNSSSKVQVTAADPAERMREWSTQHAAYLDVEGGGPGGDGTSYAMRELDRHGRQATGDDLPLTVVYVKTDQKIGGD